MLSNLDETLHHQGTRPFRSAAVSDHRFFDRYWFEALHPDGELAVITGLAFYKNMGTCDGFAAVQQHRRQHNLRLARPLDDDVDHARLGPLQVDVVRPFEEVRVSLGANEASLAFDLRFTSPFPPYAEGHHLDVQDHRVVQDSTRYDQVGSWAGWVEVAGERFEVVDWWGVRDHSWGVRANVGGFEPRVRSMPGGGLLWIWACVSTDELVCQFQLREDGQGNQLSFDGQVDYPVGSGRPSERAAGVAHDVTFIPGTRSYEHVRYDVTLASGRVITIEGVPLTRAWAYHGTGYGRGFLDGKGLGAWRGTVVEHDVYDLEHPEAVQLDGAPHPSGHREQPARVTVDGVAGFGHLPVMTAGRVERYGLG